MANIDEPYATKLWITILIGDFIFNLWSTDSFKRPIMLYTETDNDDEGNGPFQVHSEVPSELVSSKSPETLSNLSDEERCTRISSILLDKDIAQSIRYFQ
ncbi:hypothetical protein CDAR_455701 [Caerostris darwini]|uniref:Uncharacterized protein n=1 Tax=Caerostris darwini TaxID=1538125 RepID=A0AAV4SUC0_9ARAC|nr:hypothetical protein CDAR_455701 [Caerostris darwini]